MDQFFYYKMVLCVCLANEFLLYRTIIVVHSGPWPSSRVCCTRLSRNQGNQKSSFGVGVGEVCLAYSLHSRLKREGSSKGRQVDKSLKIVTINNIDDYII